MSRLAYLVVGPIAAAVLVACAGTPGPGEAGYPYNLFGSFGGGIMVEGMDYSSVLDLATGEGGELRGTYQVTNPVMMDGEVVGTLVADTARFHLSYMNPMDGCGGTLDGTGIVEEGGGAFAGRVQVNDACGGYLSGRFSFRK
jgi:hypothetical protein